jgi:hypothetical protein
MLCVMYCYMEMGCCYSSFSPKDFWSAWNAMASFFSVATGVGRFVTSTQLAARPSAASAIMLAHAMPQMLMLTLPSGARGKLKIHSA